MTETLHSKDMVLDKQLADKALQRADANELFAIYERMVKRYAEMETAFESVVKHYTGSKDVPRHQSMDSVKAMENVALAAIGLARAVASPPAADAVARDAEPLQADHSREKDFS